MLYEVLLNFLRFQSQVNREILLIKLNIEIEWGFVLFHFKNTAKKMKFSSKPQTNKNRT